jgi:hypothetical protein
MPAACRADLEALLRGRKLDRTLVPAWDQQAAPAVDMAPTGLDEVDRQLGGGWPRGQLSEVTGARSSGRTSLLLAGLAAATARGELVALIDTFDMLDPASAAAAGVDLERLLWIRGDGCTPAFPGLASRQGGPDRVIERALKALNLVLQAGGFGFVALDLADAPLSALRRVPLSTWMRLQRVLEGQDTVGLLLGTQPLSRSAGGVSLVLEPKRHVEAPGFGLRAGAGVVGRWSGAASGMRLFQGLESQVRVLRARAAAGPASGSVQIAAHA